MRYLRCILMGFVLAFGTSSYAQISPARSGTYFLISDPSHGLAASLGAASFPDTLVQTRLHILGANDACFSVAIEDLDFEFEGAVARGGVVVVDLPQAGNYVDLMETHERTIEVKATSPVNVLISTNVGVGREYSGVGNQPLTLQSAQSHTEAAVALPYTETSNEFVSYSFGDLPQQLPLAQGAWSSTCLNIISLQDSNVIEVQSAAPLYTERGSAPAHFPDSTYTIVVDSLQEVNLWIETTALTTVLGPVRGTNVRSQNNKTFQLSTTQSTGLLSSSNAATADTSDFAGGLFYSTYRDSTFRDTLFFSPALTGHYGAIFSIMAFEDGTDVFINGSYAWTLDSLDVVDTLVQGAVVVRSTKPIQQYVGSATHLEENDNGFSGFSLGGLAHDELATSSTFVTLDELDTTNHYMLGLVCRTEDTAFTTLDGSVLTGVFTRFAADTLWSWATVEIGIGTHELDNLNGVMGYQFTYHKGDSLTLFQGGYAYPSYGYVLPANNIWTEDSTANLIRTPSTGTNTFNTEGDTICLGDPVTASALGSHFSILDVDFGDETTRRLRNLMSPGVSATHIYQSTGEYWISIQDTAGCRPIDSTLVVVVDPPVANFSVDISDLCNPMVTLTSTSTNFNSIRWEIRGDLVISSEDAVLNIPLDGQVNYLEVALIASNDGCSSVRTVQLDDLGFFVPMDFPNVITPNNDGINDCFNIPSALPFTDCYEIEIFSRWGTRVFASNDPAECWEPRNIADGVYFFSVNFGTINRTGSIHVVGAD